MKIYIFKSGTTTMGYILEVEPANTILEVKEKLEALTNIPVDQVRLVFNSRSLDDERMLCDYNIMRKSSLAMSLKLRGD